jgi:ER membrane protein complex subunit 1
MGWRLLRCGVLLAFAVVWLLAAVVGALHEDEAGIIDWHHKLIGTPLEQSTFLHKPVSGSGALGFALTDRDILTALNLRDGAIRTDSVGLR